MRLGEVHGEEALDERRCGEVPRPAGIEDVEQYRVRWVVAVRGHRVVVVEIGAGAEGGHCLGVGVEEGRLGRLEVVLLERVLLPTRLQKDVEVIAIVGVGWVRGLRVARSGRERLRKLVGHGRRERGLLLLLLVLSLRSWVHSISGHLGVGDDLLELGCRERRALATSDHPLKLAKRTDLGLELLHLVDASRPTLALLAAFTVIVVADYTGRIPVRDRLAVASGSAKQLARLTPRGPRRSAAQANARSIRVR